jgi:hypothetical protein
VVAEPVNRQEGKIAQLERKAKRDNVNLGSSLDFVFLPNGIRNQVPGITILAVIWLWRAEAFASRRNNEFGKLV